MVWATKKIKYCSILLLIVYVVGCISAIAYIATGTLMPYHFEYIGMSSADVQNFSMKLHNLIVAVLKLLGVALLLLMVSSIVITLIPFRRGERWSWISTFILGLIYCIASLAVTFYIGPWIKWVTLVLSVLFLVAMLIPARDFFVKR